MLQKICEVCQKKFEAKQRKEKYCTDECYKEARRRQSKTLEQKARHAKNARNAYARNPEKASQIAKKTRAKHREQRAEDLRKWHEKHPDYKREYNRKYREKTPSRSKEHHQYYQTHKEQVSARVNARRRSDPTIMQRHNSRRRALRLNAQGDWTKAQFKELCEQVDWHCAYCHGKFDKLTPDHIIPLARGGSNEISNIIPACGPCNYSKQDKTPLEYLIRFYIR